MKKRTIFPILIIIFSFLGYIYFSTNTPTLEGRVISVSDGDTITVLTTNRQKITVRLFGIDAPELKQKYGILSKQFLINLVAGRNVEIEKIGTDTYGRVLAVIYYSHDNINIKMVEHGYAWAYRYHNKPSDPKMFDYEQEAREKKVGLWGHKNPTPPWEFRKQ